MSENPIDRFNMNFYFGSDLREIPEDAEQMRRGVEELRSLMERETDALKKASLMSQIGSYARIIGDLDLSEEMFDQALICMEGVGKIHHQLAIKLRLATVYQWRKQYAKADNIFSKSLKLIKSSDDENIKKFIDFATQHYAKSQFEQGFYKKAMDLFIEALEMRLEKGDMSLVESTQSAIQICRDKLDVD